MSEKRRCLLVALSYRYLPSLFSCLYPLGSPERWEQHSSITRPSRCASSPQCTPLCSATHSRAMRRPVPSIHFCSQVVTTIQAEWSRSRCSIVAGSCLRGPRPFPPCSYTWATTCGLALPSLVRDAAAACCPPLARGHKRRTLHDTPARARERWRRPAFAVPPTGRPRPPRRRRRRCPAERPLHRAANRRWAEVSSPPPKRSTGSGYVRCRCGRNHNDASLLTRTPTGSRTAGVSAVPPLQRWPRNTSSRGRVLRPQRDFFQSLVNVPNAAVASGHGSPRSGPHEGAGGLCESYVGRQRREGGGRDALTA